MAPEIAVLIPTLGRPEKLVPLLENVHENTEVEHRVYFILEIEDLESARALKGVDAKCIVGHFGSCAAAMNAGYLKSTEPFVHTGNDDLLYQPGWDLAALAVAEEFPIVGTNDGHGRMTCFALARRSYIEEESGVFDRANRLYHPYTSQYCDTELADYAKHRGAWGEAPESVTRHMHWEFGDADRDHPNYVKAQVTVAEDHATYLRRKDEWQTATA